MKFRFKFLFMFNVLSIVTYLGVIPKFIFYYNKTHPLIYFVMVLSLVIFSVSLFLQRFKGKYQISALITVFFSFINPVIMIWCAGGINSPGYYWLGVLPIGASMVLGKRWSLIAAIISFIFMIGFVGLDLAGVSYSVIPSQEAYIFERNSNALFFVVIIALLTYMIAHLSEKSFLLLEEQNKRTEDLLRIVVHDLNSPITVLRSKTKHISRKGNVDEKDLGVLNRSAILMGEITDSVKSMMLSNKDHSMFSFFPVDLKGCVAASVETFEGLAENKSIEINFETSLSKATIFGDEIVLHVQIFNNLLSNSIKFSPEGSKIKLYLTDEGDEYQVKIADNGSGIEKERLDSIFEIWVGKSTLGSAGEKGTGFGLNIVKNFIDHLDGSITVETSTEPGSSGTTFILSFPKFTI